VSSQADRFAESPRRGGSRRPPEADAEEVMGRPSPRRGAKRTVLGTIRQIPHYLRLLGGLVTDRRVNAVDKVLVAAAIAYVIAPIDLIPDFIPFIGEVDDVFLLVTALQRLISNAGRLVVLDHWAGDPAELSDMNLRAVLSAASFFLPMRLRRRLKTIGRD
jgi:uncharacterized membrane protein YkvA (DUF1232 family)